MSDSSPQNTTYGMALGVQRAANQKTKLIQESQGNQCIEFLLVIMANGIAHERVCMLMAQSHKMAATLQLIA